MNKLTNKNVIQNETKYMFSCVLKNIKEYFIKIPFFNKNFEKKNKIRYQYLFVMNVIEGEFERSIKITIQIHRCISHAVKKISSLFFDNLFLLFSCKNVMKKRRVIMYSNICISYSNKFFI